MIAAVYPDRPTLHRAAAERVEQQIARALETRDRAAICLTGGETAGDVYAVIAANERQSPRIGWKRLELFWGDERDVPPDHPDSNYGMAAAALLNHVPVDPALVHRIPADGRDADAAARAYEMTLRRTVLAARADYAFELMLLGIGADAHLASLFPGAAALVEPSIPRVVAVPAAGNRGRRITLTPDTLLDARTILVVVSGREKADAVHAAFSLPEDVSRWPAQILRRAGGRVEWLMDSAAAARVPAAPRASR